MTSGGWWSSPAPGAGSTAGDERRRRRSSARCGRAGRRADGRTDGRAPGGLTGGRADGPRTADGPPDSRTGGRTSTGPGGPAGRAGRTSTGPGGPVASWPTCLLAGPSRSGPSVARPSVLRAQTTSKVNPREQTMRKIPRTSVGGFPTLPESDSGPHVVQNRLDAIAGLMCGSGHCRDPPAGRATPRKAKTWRAQKITRRPPRPMTASGERRAASGERRAASGERLFPRHDRATERPSDRATENVSGRCHDGCSKHIAARHSG